MIFRNDVTLLGNVLGVKKLKNEFTRLKMEVPYTKKNGEKDSHTIQVDFIGDIAEEAAVIEVGTSLFVKAIMVKRQAPGDDGKKYSILTLQADEYKGFRSMAGKVDDGFCEVVFAGRVMKDPILRQSKSGPYCFLEMVYNRPGAKKDEEKGTFIDVGVSGNSAEKYVTVYIKEGDQVLAQGYLSPREEKFEVKGKKPWGLNFSASAFAGIQAVTPAPRGSGGGNKTAKAVPVDDDDIPF
jgi:single-stranded DNA-binding protein